MNKKGGDVLRILLGCYLVFIGTSLWIQVSKANPNNERLMVLASAVMIVAGLAYGLFSLKRITGFSFKFMKKRTDRGAQNETEREKNTEDRKKAEKGKNAEEKPKKPEAHPEKSPDMPDNILSFKRGAAFASETRVIEKIEDLWIAAEGEAEEETVVQEQDEEAENVQPDEAETDQENKEN